jgi:hypothetical protein
MRTALEAIEKNNTTPEAKAKAAKKAETAPKKPSQELQNWGNGHGRKNVAKKTQNLAGAETAQNSNQGCSLSIRNERGFDLRSPQKSPHSGDLGGHRGVGRGAKSLKINGSSGRTRTYNPSVNSGVKLRNINNLAAQMTTQKYSRIRTILGIPDPDCPVFLAFGFEAFRPVICQICEYSSTSHYLPFAALGGFPERWMD